MAKKLWASWFSGTRSTAEMKRGTKNEASVTRALATTEWVEAIWDVGLVAMESHPWIAVSADGLMLVHPPHALSEAPMPALLEIKTKLSQPQIAKSKRTARTYGKYFSCTVGSPQWFHSVPAEYRGQLIHQALVFGLARVVLVMATVTGILYSVLVTVPSHVRRVYLSSLQPYSVLCTWAHEANPEVAPLIPPDLQEIALSHLPLWRALNSRKLPLYPMRTIKSAIQVQYSVYKPGVDGATQFLSFLRSPTVRYSWEQRIVVDTFLSVAVNAVLMFRLWNEIQNGSWRGSLDHFRDALSRSQTFCDSVLSLIVELLADATLTVTSQGARANVLGTRAGMLNVKKRGRLKFFNSGEGRKFRLDATAHHLPARTRIVCHRHPTWECGACSVGTAHVPLCLKPRRPDSTETCFQYFHKVAQLTYLSSNANSGRERRTPQSDTD
eukprot:INCI5038.6.p1 GENE.INCI5038.6~~INCI5038.6.p1  ORF type:complete len:440 (-),score=39.65 INCI5038.6:22-1341(-)